MSGLLCLGVAQQDLLKEIADYLEDCQDVVDGSDGQPQPNRAMVLLTEMHRLGLAK